jgi:hypothetical protein
MKSAQERSVRYERERREASERHRRKVEQMAKRQKQGRLEDRARDSETSESSA